MRKYLFVLPLHLGLLLVTSLASAQINEREKFSGIEDATEPPNLNHFGLSYRAGFNINASFKNLSSSPASAPGLPIQGVDHNYDNGYNRVDASGNAGGMTWNWGYTGVGYGGAPQVVNRTPRSFANFYPAASGLSFNATTLTTTNPINTGAIRLFLNGVNVSSALNISGPTTNALVTYSGLTSNAVYDARIELQDAVALPTRRQRRIH